MATDSIHRREYAVMVALLREYRETKPLTQSELAAMIGGDQTLVSKYETRERRLDLVEVRTICQALEVPFEDFVAEWESRLEDETDKPAETDPLDPFDGLPESDKDWTAEDWQRLINWFIDSDLVTFQELAALMLGHLNPSQVGTSIASKKTFQSHFPKRKTWQAVRQWHFDQTGQCADCGTRLELQADHIETKEEQGDAADRLENMTLRCRRCNVIRRPSHAKGGLTFLTAESALMWLLFTRRPKNYSEFEAMCRDYGMTMASIRFQEAWAMARWLNRIGLYEIDEDSEF